jgi:tRNA pseudouridine32 synthase/23S rRNA pseudouridine746 synthase
MSKMLSIKTIFKNQFFIVVDKPANTLSTPSRIGKSDPRPVVGLLVQEQLNQRVFPVHRLDENVSGLLMFALSESAHRAANRWFEQHEISKVYEACSIPIPEAPTCHVGEVFVWESKLVRGKRRTFEAPYGKDAVTRARLSATDSARSIWHLKPLTGRSHQLRYEMAKHGFCIDGDSLYGSTRSGPQNGGIALRSIRLSFRNVKDAALFDLPETITLDSETQVDRHTISEF